MATCLFQSSSYEGKPVVIYESETVLFEVCGNVSSSFPLQ